MDSPQLMGQQSALRHCLRKGPKSRSVEVLFMGFAEAEAVKLFANTYLAMRISFFNDWIPMQRSSGLIQNRSSGAFAWIPGLNVLQ